MKKIFFLAIYYLVSLYAYSTDFTKYKVVLFVFKDRHAVCIYNTPQKDSVIAKIYENGKAGMLNGFDVLEKQDSMIRVVAWNTVNEKKIKGWIKITETAINGRQGYGIYELYDQPDNNSKKTVVKESWPISLTRGGKLMRVTDNIDSNFRVFDIQNDWLKVEVKGKDKTYIKWLPRRYQCQDVSGECS